MAKGEPADARVKVYPAGEDDKVASRHPVADPGDYPAKFRLKPGSYDMVVRARDLDVADKWVEGVAIGAGEKISRVVEFAPSP